jgi:hypothetical protein
LRDGSGFGWQREDREGNEGHVGGAADLCGERRPKIAQSFMVVIVCFLSSLTGLQVHAQQGPSHEWPGYFQEKRWSMIEIEKPLEFHTERLDSLSSFA